MEPVVTSALIGAGASALAGGTSAVAQSSLNKKTREFNREEAEKQRAWNEAMADKQNAWNFEMWMKQNEYNSPTAQVERLRDAGLNPLYYGLDGSSAGQLSAAQPLGYERAKMDNQPNPFEGLGKSAVEGAGLFMQGKLAEKELELKNTQIDKLKEDTAGVKLDNQWKDNTLQARSDAESLRNDLTRKQIDQVDSQIKKNEQDVKESIERTKNEEEKRGLLIAQKCLADAQAKEIVSLLPYKKLLTEAQTMAQKASASASWTHAAYEQGLLDSGYIDKMVSDLDASIRQKNSAAEANEAMKAVNAWKLAVKNGNAFDLSSYAENDIVSQGLATILNSLFSIISTASEAVGGGLSGFFK